jgi:alpha,alpha-trehalose phosphorylase
LHIASLAGAWIAAVCGFGGLRDVDGRLRFKPRLPPSLARLAFGITFRGRRLRVEVDQRQASYSLRDGEPLHVEHHGEGLDLSSGAPVTRPIPALTPREPPSQPPGRAPERRSR